MNPVNSVQLSIPFLLAEAATKKLAEKLDSKLAERDRKKPDRIKANKKKISYKYSKRLGFEPIDAQNILIKQLLNDRIINEFRKKKIRHIDLSGMTGISRPKITQILNRKLQKVSIDFLIRIANALEMSVTVDIQRNK